jgi:CHAT domain-containing protein
VADRSGLKPGDVLLEYNGTALKAPTDLKPVAYEDVKKSVSVKFWRDGEIRSVEVAAGKLGISFDPRRSAADVVLARRAAEETMRPLTRGGSWARLPGTRREVEAIAGLFAAGQVETLLGERANESEVQALAAKGILKSYRFLHFAAHGQANLSVAMYSSLVLAPAPERSADLSAAFETDGRITAQQIVNTWDLDADLVVLSACESGLGKYAGGESYLGFTQALFVKGARSVVLSLWKVDDRATALLMTRFYQNLLRKRPGLSAAMPKAEALDASKSWLRGLSTAEVSTATEALSRGEIVEIKGKPVEVGDRPFEHPKFWAGFILVGDPN